MVTTADQLNVTWRSCVLEKGMNYTWLSLWAIFRSRVIFFQLIDSGFSFFFSTFVFYLFTCIFYWIQLYQITLCHLFQAAKQQNVVILKAGDSFLYLLYAFPTSLGAVIVDSIVGQQAFSQVVHSKLSFITTDFLINVSIANVENFF